MPYHAPYGSPPRVRGKLRPRVLLTFTLRITPACAGKTRCGFHSERRRADHPRVCGENSAIEAGQLSHRGSPPRVRGKPVTVQQVRHHARITPACAGKTKPPTTARQPRADHPRVCGENDHSALYMPNPRGSPPRVRGKRHVSASMRASAWITPACAGKTPFHAFPSFISTDHPRVCGENSEGYTQTKTQNGSPPRVRGKLLSRAFFSLRQRITPACAGKT